jgi:hypothetical protein
MRSLRWLVSGGVALLSPVVLASAARAEASVAADPGPGATGASVAVSPQLAFVHAQGFEPYAAVAVTPSYRFSRHFELALNLSYAHGPSGTEVDGFSREHEVVTVGRDMLTAGAEARYRAALGDDALLWVGGELGAADGIRTWNGSVNHFGASLVGAGTGLALLLGRTVSLGLEARTRVMSFEAPPSDGFNQPNGITPAFYGGFVVAVRMPGER